jgi:hypothetical protein
VQFAEDPVPAPAPVASTATTPTAPDVAAEVYEDPPFLEEEWASSAGYAQKMVESFRNQAVASATNSTFDSSSAAVKTGAASGAGTVNAGGATGVAGVSSAKKAEAVAWVKDNTVTACMICGGGFSLIHRRHHCRRCGRMVCATCAPGDNSRPIPEWGLMSPERHCVLCYKSPAVNWKT